MAKVKAVLEFTFDTADDSYEETLKYLESSSGFESLEWMGKDAKIEFKELE